MRHHSSRFTLGLCFLLPSLLLAGTGRAAEPIRINGSGSGLQMMQPLLAAYTKAHPEAQVEVDKPLGSSGAIKALLAGALDISVTSRDLKPEEVKAGASLQRYGQTPLALVSHKDVVKKDLTRKELVDIFAGATTTWPDGKPIRLVLRPVEDADTKILRKLSPEMDAAVTSAQARPGMITAVTDPECTEAIAKTPGALGASGLPGVIVDQLPVNVMTLDGVAPSPEVLAKGGYPFVKPIDFVTMPTLSAEGKQLLAFVYSPEGRAIAKEAGVWVMAGESAPK